MGLMTKALNQIKVAATSIEVQKATGKTPAQVAAERGLEIPIPDRDGWAWAFDASGNIYRYNIPAKSKSITSSVSRSLNSTVGVVAKIPAVQTAAKIAAGAAVTVAAGAVGVAVAGALGGTAGAAALKEAKKAVDEAKEKGEDVAKAVEMPVQLRPNIAMPQPPPGAAVDALFKDSGTAVQIPYKRPEAEQYAAGTALPADSPGTVPAGTPRQLDFLEQIFAGIAKILNIG